MSDPQNLLYRMMGGVAGAMDQVDSNTMTKLPTGQYGYVPSTRHLDKMNQMMQPNFQQNMPVSNYRPNVFNPNFQVQPQQQQEDKMDISKYIGKNKLQPQKPQSNSQLELLKTALEPISEQLEKICILLGLIYQSVDKGEVEEQKFVAPASSFNVNEIDEAEGLPPEKEIEMLEKKISSRKPSSTVEELGEMNDDIDDVE